MPRSKYAFLGTWPCHRRLRVLFAPVPAAWVEIKPCRKRCVCVHAQLCPPLGSDGPWVVQASGLNLWCFLHQQKVNTSYGSDPAYLIGFLHLRVPNLQDGRSEQLLLQRQAKRGSRHRGIGLVLLCSLKHSAKWSHLQTKWSYFSFSKTTEGHILFKLTTHIYVFSIWVPKSQVVPNLLWRGSIFRLNTVLYRCHICQSWTPKQFLPPQDLRAEDSVYEPNRNPLPGPTATGCVTLSRWLTLSMHRWNGR